MRLMDVKEVPILSKSISLWTGIGDRGQITKRVHSTFSRRDPFLEDHDASGAWSFCLRSVCHFGFYASVSVKIISRQAGVVFSCDSSYLPGCERASAIIVGFSEGKSIRTDELDEEHHRRGESTKLTPRSHRR